MDRVTYTRTYTGADGHTHFEDVAVPLPHERGQGRESDVLPAHSIHFRHSAGGMSLAFHNAPRRRLIIIRNGGLEVETGLGDKRQFRQGDVLEVTDTNGHGHITRALDGQVFDSIFINLDAEIVTPSLKPVEGDAGGLDIIRCIAGEDGRSHFVDGRLPYVEASASGKVTAEMPLAGFQFVWKPASFDFAYHQAPQRQAVLCLTGGIEVESSQGDKRRVDAKTLYFGEDTTGQGHISRALDGQPRLSIFAHLA